jgi:FkbM family methyltransferase
MTQRIKDWLVGLGPDNAAVRAALGLHGWRQGFGLEFATDAISVRRGRSRMILPKRQFNLLPIMLECYDDFFKWIETTQQDGYEFLDFSTPGFHRYRQLGVGFHFPGIPEDYTLDAYTHWYKPGPGDVVFDVGGHAGMTAYFLSQMVGQSGRVVSFEPDDSNYDHLLRNIEHHRLTNVITVKKAMAASTGTALFNMDGTMAAGLSEFLVYPNTGRQVTVETVSLGDACREFGVPAFMKMDIEGAEVDLIRSSLPFLREHAVHMSFDSYHRLRDGAYTWRPLEDLLRSIGYAVESSAEFGQMFTWARPASALMRPA